MAVILQMSIDPEEFALGRVTKSELDIHIELERVVPTGGETMPFFWATGDDLEMFERAVRDEGVVKDLTAVAKVDDQILYHVRWNEEATSLADIFTECEATILEAYGNSPWMFRLRFNDHRDVRDFHNLCREAGISFHVDRLYTLDEKQDAIYDFGLTASQEVALVKAVEMGYFDVPREATLEEIADELEITPQAASELIRRGANAVLQSVLIDRSAADFD